MRALPLKTLSVAALVAVVAVTGCTKSKVTDSAQTTKATAPTSTAAPAQAAPADNSAVQGADVAPVASSSSTAAAAPTSAEGFENNAANYTGDVRTRVIYFAFDKSDIPTAAIASLKAHAKVLAGNPAARLKLEGHADERGTPEYNVALAERRAKAVQKFLVFSGAKANQIETVSYGEEKPADLGHDELAWAHNRRVELVYTAGAP